MPYYHVYICDAHARVVDEVYEFDFSKEKLEECIVEPYLTGKEFIFDGTPRDPFEVEKIKISRTEQPSSVLIPKIKARPDYYHRVGVEHYVVDEGVDVTREFITHPPRKEKKILVRKKHLRTVASLSKNVFIVHGKDYKPMKELKTMLEEFALDPVVLHEKPSASKTIVEKLEKYSDVGYAFVILTPDDGSFNLQTLEEIMDRIEVSRLSPKREDDVFFDSFLSILTKVARQNVILEFGYFMGLLGRDRVCCLYKGDVELPSDMHGIAYIPFKESINEVKGKIVNELRAAGYEIKI